MNELAELLCEGVDSAPPQSGEKRRCLMQPMSLTQIIDRVRYSTKTATLVCGDDWWDGHNHERRGRNRFLYRARTGRYFFLVVTAWQGEFDHIEPCDQEEAITFYESCAPDCQRVPYAEAFPDVTVEEA